LGSQLIQWLRDTSTKMQNTNMPMPIHPGSLKKFNGFSPITSFTESVTKKAKIRLNGKENEVDAENRSGH
jgi:hypothetical protein